MRKFSFFIMLILILFFHYTSKAEEKNKNESKTNTGIKIGTFSILLKYDYWGNNFNLKDDTNSSDIIPKQKVNGQRVYLNLKANIKNLLTLEKTLTVSNYDYLNIHPSGIAGTFIGFTYYKIDQNDLNFKKYWFGLLSGLLAAEYQKYNYNKDGVVYNVEKNKYGIILGEGWKLWYDAIQEISGNLLNSGGGCNFYFIFGYCNTGRSVYYMIPAGDFYYIKAKYKTNSQQFDATGTGIAFGLKLIYEYKFSENLFLSLQGRYVYGTENLSYKDNNNNEQKLNDIIQDYYARIFFSYRFSL